MRNFAAESIVHQRPTMPRRNNRDEQEPRRDSDRQTSSLAALAFVLALVIAGLFLTQTLRRGGQVEDCLMAGRRDCDKLLAR